MASRPRFLVVDGYAREGREELTAAGATAAGELYARTLELCWPGVESDIVAPAEADARLPQGAEIVQYDGVVWTGSSLTVFHDDSRVHSQIALARAVFAAGVPSFGSCWAAQVHTVAAGGLCAASPRGREIGIARNIALTPDGRAHPLYRGKKSVFSAPASHDDEITHLPPGALRLAENDHSFIQAVSIPCEAGTFWGVQYHPELDLHELARLTYARRALLTGRGFFADEETALGYVDLLETLHRNPERKDIAWLLGVDSDLLEPRIRLAEIHNWIEFAVMPWLADRTP